jgi:hypothetical protein
MTGANVLAGGANKTISLRPIVGNVERLEHDPAKGCVAYEVFTYSTVAGASTRDRLLPNLHGAQQAPGLLLKSRLIYLSRWVVQYFHSAPAAPPFSGSQ